MSEDILKESLFLQRNAARSRTLSYSNESIAVEFKQVLLGLCPNTGFFLLGSAFLSGRLFPFSCENEADV